MHVDGPYGDSGERPAWLKHPVLAIFAGGIGVCLLHGSYGYDCLAHQVESNPL